ncbi:MULTISPECIES: pyridoxal 5'-phosphate synthase glutaminase subunit PdxT [unclassified Paenibacillus]|uniref:pyridoxal 5'-phosphate synthase glutaminase subunit PdxT n=1 Tax=unclassified Paenibacillus TaxID=185978 RepID=UPI0024060F2D|nr:MULTISPECIES: pyridoxal 5'-phosphate synthase glutaminase subunit PdxT [unclassified Paenibacillus]MDF9844870.1 5'-phosphate synthase pdxT subunit [Paenibacillus sp. PastF-2]MDF9851469.1 5'-phosphate synthase pdxT subunit [Paenibacillus sp. PastM-2]MDF9858053.1 5'-phosphate synthase pdxT subunit [Paenibacillus sp. PastF-1]MDH6483360.1 5'-phosphate synthase pdxT subunit [Paenibacillus sp. PastH-2]MDH6510769.1 5'-phosphate synthase pdxT subunit [Paenibacillus sp. PastM-3]
MRIGVLALQGAVTEHIVSIEKTGAEGLPIKRVEQLEEVDGLIIPGGESTTIGKLMRKYDFIEAIRDFSGQGKPIFGTCAGMIVLAKRIAGGEDSHLGLMDITVARNAFGRQRESFECDLDVKGISEPVRAVFIRAPLISEVGPEVDVLTVYNNEIVTARQDNLLVSSFHPELTEDYRLHQYFADMVKAKAAATQ